MKGIEFEEIRNAIVGAFDGDDFDMLLYERLDYDRPQHVGDGPFKRVASEVLKDFQQQGLDAILIAEVAAKRPMKREIQEIYRKYAASMVDESRQREVDANRAKAIERYGLIKEVTIQGDGIARMTAKSSVSGALERAITSIPMLNYRTWLRQMLNWEGKVCRVEIDGIKEGTGFLVGEDLVLTNYHVVERMIHSPGGQGFVARFDVSETLAGANGETVVRGAAAGWLVAHGPYAPHEDADVRGVTPDDTQLDFALVRLAQKIGSMPLISGSTGSAPRGWVSLPSVPPPLGAGMPLIIIQHPEGGSLKMAIDLNSVIEVTPNQRRVRYRTNTEGGSSGSPVTSLDGQLVALHHLGHPLGLKGVPVPDGFNQGIPIISIYERLQALGLGPLVTTPSP